VQVQGPDVSGFLTGVTAVAAGAVHSLALAPPLPLITVSGTVALGGIAPTAPAQTLTFTLRYQTGDTALTSTLTLHSGDAFSLTDIPARSYILHVMGSKWLAKNVAVDALHGDVTGLSLTLVAGDINNDNSVNILDLGLLADAFNSTPTDPNWNANADLNADGQVDITDLGLLADGFGRKGDP
jgi:hypothetical protein